MPFSKDNDEDDDEDERYDFDYFDYEGDNVSLHCFARVWLQFDI